MSTGSDNSQPGATVCVCPESVMGDLVIAAFFDRNLSLFDVRKCGLDGRFKTERLLPGKYAIIAEAYVPEKKEEMPVFDDSGMPPEVSSPTSGVRRPHGGDRARKRRAAAGDDRA